MGFGKREGALFYDVIKYDSQPGVLMHRHERKDFNKNSTIQVQPAQKAFLYVRNQLVGVYDSGDYKAEAKGIPIVSEIQRAFHGGERHQSASVYFVNTLTQNYELSITDCTFIDKLYKGAPLPVGFSATVMFKVADPLILQNNLSGVSDNYTIDDFTQFIENILKGELRSNFSALIQNGYFDYFNMLIQLPQLNAQGGTVIRALFSNYGLEVTNFSVNTISSCIANNEELEANPDYQNYKNWKFADGLVQVTQAQFRVELERVLNNIQIDMLNQDKNQREQLLAIQVRQFKNLALGITEKERLAYGIALAMASNQGAGGVSNIAAGVGTMAGMYSAGMQLTPLLTNAMNEIGLSTQNVQTNNGPVTYFGVNGGVGLATNHSNNSANNTAHQTSQTKNSTPSNITKITADELFKGTRIEENKFKFIGFGNQK